MKNLLLASTSTLFGENYLEYLLDDVALFFKDVDTITFIPFARPGGISHDNYTAIAAKAFAKIDKKIVGLHTYPTAQEGINQSQAFFCGGGNTFLLVQQLYAQNAMQHLQEHITNGKPYMGTSAGSNIAGVSMHTTNDMPIVYPPSFATMQLVPFNINAHYLDPDPNSKHNGETRETRLKEFHVFNTTPVVGLREGSFLLVNNNTISLKGKHTARIFEPQKAPYESKTIQF
ncbi:dipeptidase PepE [Cellulophaga lytica]|uniref:(Alpha)-aspartyl dipeptidase n=1 Tax=Cellulophaga geojensis KL-A TaxID=1328323 RepID=A0ABN0RM05_9FLAO|nr:MULTISPECIES: dipeptidase PepE [Cellulophaga]AIM59501.1 (alpha)-aspartyl dipeptidase [Cellulophaga lytica]EWH12873.1 (alpha)-aspartyl dipeptidase [Cellulophaga geojensis KL-A]TVZ08991.1 dipeptidase E [Cellulophaga sp. RHA_52]SNQ44078.1 Peptidase E [Cellulophaga lytica]